MAQAQTDRRVHDTTIPCPVPSTGLRLVALGLPRRSPGPGRRTDGGEALLHGSRLFHACRRKPVSMTSPRLHASVTIEAQSDVIAARHAGRELARALGFGTVDQTRLATAISELVRNTLQHAGRGLCSILEEADADGASCIRVVVSDEGPGIFDVESALRPGFSTGGGLGLGLPAVERLTDKLEIDSHPGRTVIEITMSRKR